MASADLRAELQCSICLNIYTDPVMLRCGDKFCLSCIEKELNTQEDSDSEGYFCPACSKDFRSRPLLWRNITLHNIVQNFQAPRNVLQELRKEREETEEKIKSLQEDRREEEAAGDPDRVLREISGGENLTFLSIQVLELKKEELSRKIHHLEELSRKIHHLEELCNMTESDTGDTEDRERREALLRDGGGLGVAGISLTLHTGLSGIITEVNLLFPIQEAADILLDVNTAFNYLQISDDMKTVTWSHRYQNHPETPERFQSLVAQVLSSQSFPSGRHYWDVDVGGSDAWGVGMCYPSIGRRGWDSLIGKNKKSWGLLRSKDGYLVIHDSKGFRLPPNFSSNRFRIYLDYEAGKISFYDLCDPIRHIRTFTTTFTEPLHAGIGVWEGCIKICEGNREM